MEAPADLFSRLPTEIADNICFFLHDDKDIQSVRLLSKFWRDVATPRLLDLIRLCFGLESFQRLDTISQHPVLSKTITSLLYEPNALCRYETQEEWEKHIMWKKIPLNEIPSIPGPDATDRERRLFERTVTKLHRRPKHTYSGDDLTQGYLQYQKHFSEQQHIRGRNYGSEAIYEAMTRLPKLNNISMDMRFAFNKVSNYSRNTFRSALVHVAGDNSHPMLGYCQMKSLLLGAKRANLRLEKLSLGYIDWKFLRQDQNLMDQMKSTLTHLKGLQLGISLPFDEETGISYEVGDCRDFLGSSTRLRDFLAAAPYLEILSVAFDWAESLFPADFKDVFSTTTWPLLTIVSFENIDTMGSDWVAFFNRHASTLKKVSFKTIRLMEGEWWEVLKDMREGLHLESAKVWGELLGDGPPQHWLLEPDFWAQCNDMRSQGNRTSKAVQDYLMGAEGICPLLDDNAHPELSIDGF